jgi:uncharacterized protein
MPLIRVEATLQGRLTAMRLDLSHIRQPETEFNRIIEPSAVAGGEEEFRVTAPVVLRMVIHKDHDRFRLVGSTQTNLELVCSRCLEPFGLPVDREFDLRYLPAGTAAEGSDEGEDGTEVEDDDLSMTFYRDEHIDLGDMLREQFYLALPMKPLCRADCRGLCPHCGTNLNVESCACQPQWEDPRLAGLKALMTERKHDDA